MDRRTFLKATLVTAGSIALGPACGDDGSQARANRAYIPGDVFFPQSVASGDPKPDSVILWTRVENPNHLDETVVLELEVSLDAEFTTLLELEISAAFGRATVAAQHGVTSAIVPASPSHDHCVKVKLAGLAPATQYYYRFVYEIDGEYFTSQTGSAKTAPAADSDVPVRFALANCQDYNGRYYNSYRRMLQEDLDFFVHVGDYVYETTGDPSFQDTHPDRVTTFSDEAGAIVFHEGTEDEYLAAKSLSNYRDLYKTYRSDPDLQAAHERWPMIAIWDDHEFSDDCWGANATYYDGEEDEYDLDRRKAANQAWFEYMPVDYMDDEDFVYDPNAEYPNDIKIYRDLEFGANLHLLMTDLRTYRADHLIPEDAYPGAIAMTQAELEATAGELPAFATPYVAIETYADGIYETALTDAAEELGIDPAMIAGNIAVSVINSSIEAINEGLSEGEQIPLITEEEQADMDLGLAMYQMMKSSPYGALGSRYFVIKDTFDLYAAFKYQQTNGASEAGMGGAQEEWFLDTMHDSNKTWKVWGNEFTLMPRIVDLRPLTMLPDQFRQVIKISAEDWDGMPIRRDHLLSELADVDNVVAITGDIHAFFAGTPEVSDDPTKKIVEFVAGAISSGTWRTLITRTVTADPELAAAGAGSLAAAIDQFLAGSPGARPNPHLAHIDVARHGFISFSLDSETFEATMHAIDEEHVSTDLGAGPNLDDKFVVTRFKVDAGSRDLLKDVDGSWKRWDPDEYDWV